MSETLLVLYDIRTKPSHAKCFSPNVWKVRLLLEYKRIPYRTEWIEFPDIAPTFKALGVKPNKTPEECMFEYSCPMVRFPGRRNGEEGHRYVMESRNIAKAVEEWWPENTVWREEDEEINARVQGIVDGLMVALAPPVIYRIPEWLLDWRSAEYYSGERTRSMFGGLGLYEIRDDPRIGGEAAWRNAELPLRGLANLLKERGEGDFIMGKRVSLGDFVVVGLWRLLESLDAKGDLYGRVMGFDAAFGRLEEACGEWIGRAD